jgi:hypothetical protein
LGERKSSLVFDSLEFGQFINYGCLRNARLKRQSGIDVNAHLPFIFSCESRKTKLLSAAIGLAALIATPALAQSYAPEFDTGNIIPNATNQSSATSAFAQADPIARPSSRDRIRVQHQGGVIDGAPAGVDPYQYHDDLMAKEAN